MKITLRSYQQVVFDKVIAHFKSKNGAEPAIVDMSVGSGKTALAAFLAKNSADKGGRVMLIARQGELVQQDGEFAENMGMAVSYYSSSLGAKSVRNSTIMGTEGTIVRALDSAFKEWSPDLILWDEAHQGDYEREESMFMRIMSHFQTINPKARILGLTGSPFRGTDSMIGDFWRSCLATVSTDYLINDGWLVQPHFGWPEHISDSFDFSQLEQESGGFEFTDEQMDKLRDGDPTKTERIMAEVVHRTADDLGVLIFAQTKKHCLEVAGALPPGSWAIITDETPDKERASSLAKAKTGEIKYMINVAVLTTGVDCPFWQSIVYLRPVGSLVLLIQSIGRILRLLIDAGIDMGALDREGRLAEIAASRKPFARVYDYAGVMDRLGHLYEDPLLAQAQLEKSKREGSVIYCPCCNVENSDKARRCIGVDHKGVRCDHFWLSQDCRKCGAKNDVTARDCRVCGEQLIDPNAKLLHKAYTDSELSPVAKMEMEPTKNGGMLVRYILDTEKPDHGWPVEFFNPAGSPTAKRVWYNNFVKSHVRASKCQSQIYGMRTVAAILKMKAMFNIPTHIAYRINDKGKFVIGRRRFNDGITSNEKGDLE
jgi:superfamily II DNA or RNA helicase